MSYGYGVDPAVLANMERDLDDGVAGLVETSNRIEPYPPDAGASTAALDGVLNQFILGVASLIADVEDSMVNIGLSRDGYVNHDSNAACTLSQLRQSLRQDLPRWMTPPPIVGPGSDCR